MKFKVGDIVKPKEPQLWEKWYNIRYKIKEIDEWGWAVLEPIIEKKEEMIEEMMKDIEVDTEGWPLGVDVRVEIAVKEEVYPLDEDEWEVVEC